MAFSLEQAVTLAELGVTQIVLGVINKLVNDTTILTECFHALSGLCRAEANAIAMAEPVQ